MFTNKEMMAKLILGILTIGTLFSLMVNGFVVPELINAENKDYMFPLTRTIDDVNFTLLFALLIYYLIFLFRTNKVPKEKKYLWAAVLFLGNVFAFPIMWYHYIWKNNEKT